MQKNEIEPLLYSIHTHTHTQNSKRIKDLNVQPKTVNILEENIGKKLHYIVFGNDFLDMIPKAQATKVKIGELYIINISKFCAPKDTINRVKRKLTE